MVTTETRIRIHEAAALIPDMTKKAYEEFKEDIRKNGLLQPIELLPDGAIIDGRHRYRACIELGIKPTFVTVDPVSPLAHVKSMNKHRRHLTSEQAAMLAALELPKFQAEAKERKREGGRRSGATRRGEDPKQVPDLRSIGEAREAAAKAFGTNKQYVLKAERLHKEAPDLFEKVKEGTMRIREAEEEVAERTGTRKQLLAKAAVNRANEFVSRIEGCVLLCEKVNVDAIKSDVRILRDWKESLKNAMRAMRTLLQQLEN